jgi:general L-amino acid transport system permease protein
MPDSSFKPLTWLQTNLFGSWANSLLTLVLVVLLYKGLGGMIFWAINSAQWQVVWLNLRGLMIGRYPLEQLWQLWFVGGAIAIGIALSIIGTKLLSGFYKFQLIGLIFLLSAIWIARPLEWQGLLLTLLLAGSSLLLSFPLGFLLAYGRQSKLIVFRFLCVAYIELVRGVPLIAVLFMAQVMLPLFLPPGVEFARVGRAIAALSLFAAAYTAENLRGGFQSVTQSQKDAAVALGLSSFAIMFHIILPQALRAVLPALTGQAIGLLMDTSLASQVGLLELTGISRSLLAQPQFIGRYAEVYLFVALLYWLFCAGISQLSKRLEQKWKY